MHSFEKRTWIEIDLDKLTSNYRNVCKMVPENTKVTCVLKGNAYGHGSVQVAKALQKEGCRSFAVSCVREGMELRKALVQGEILVMGFAIEEEVSRALKAELTLTVSRFQQAEWISLEAQRQNRQVPIQVKIDTGMHRLGFPATDKGVEDVAKSLELPNIIFEGIFSHLALINDEHDLLQRQAFEQVIDKLGKKGINPKEKHLCDSIGTLWYPKWHDDRVRIGALLYGVYPARTGNEQGLWQQTLTLKTVVAQVNEMKKGDYIGYDDKAPMDHDGKVAALCAGYGDGYPRVVYEGAVVVINGQEAPILGIACMDQMMVDVTHVKNINPGDIATLLGDGIDYLRFATFVKTNRNEVLTKMSRRPVRVYYQNGEIVHITDDLE